MSPERWQQVERLYQAACERPAEERRQFLDNACGGDEQLRREVESLLAFNGQASQFLETPALETTARSLAQPLAEGTRLGPYVIAGQLGAGGMGEVYRAEDTRLGRQVAIKFLPDRFAGEARALERFQREARLLASLNHPHICTLYDVGPNYLVMELVEGETLAARLGRGPLPVALVLRYGAEIADALAAAHSLGIINRDLKPGNIMVTKTGVKVLDLGLAKFSQAADASPRQAETLTAGKVILGTPAYMAPEQVCGEEVDGRTDLFSFGAVLYEMATGKRAFPRYLDRTTPPAVETDSELQRIIGKLLKTDRGLRYQTASDVLVDLRRRQRAVDGTAAPASRRWRAVALAGAALVAVAIALWGAVGFGNHRQHQPGVPEIHSIAVLPLKNLSGDPQQEYFADGITELLTGELSNALPIRVTSRTSAMRYGNTDKPLPVIARELNVDAVLEGSVVRSGNRLRVTAQLIHGPSDRHLWAETYDRDLVDVPVLETEIARAVAHEIRANTAPSIRRRRPAVNPDAFEAYLRARYYLDQRTAQNINKAISFYQKAIEEDPAYAPAYAGLADCYNQLGTVIIGDRSPPETRKLAMAAANRALEIDPELAEAHAALAYSNLYDWNWTRAEQGFERAIVLNPNYAPAHLWFAHYLAARGQFDRALQEVRLANDLDPLSPIIQTQIGWILKHARRFPEAIAQFRKTLEQNPSYSWAQWQLAGVLMFTHDYSAAIETCQNAATVGNRSPSALGTIGMAYGLAGRRREAEQVLDELLALSRRRYVSPFSIMDIYLGLGDRDKAFEWMEKCYQERTNGMAWLAVAPEFDPIREDPRFDMYLRRIGLK
jgi:serine/threonine-protein kinase